MFSLFTCPSAWLYAATYATRYAAADCSLVATSKGVASVQAKEDGKQATASGAVTGKGQSQSQSNHGTSSMERQDRAKSQSG